MKRFFLFSVLFFFSLTLQAEEKTTLPGGSCYNCHLEMEDDSASLWKDDIHALNGIGCEACHGGDPLQTEIEKAKGPNAHFKGTPKKMNIPELCASCHSSADIMKKYNPLLPTDQREKYLTSVHGKKLKKGDTNVAQCASCHGAHGIRKVNDAKSPVYANNLPAMCSKCHSDADKMKPYKIPTDQYANYIQSVHGKALLEKGDVRGAPACNDCHGNHGAAPPGMDSIVNICGSCHAHNAELFLKSPMADPLKKKTLAECVACHGNHKIVHTSDDWIGSHDGALCLSCHKKGDKGANIADLIYSSIGGVKKEFAEAKKLIDTAREKGMDIVEGEDHLQAANQALIQVRTEIHSFSKPIVDAKLDEAKKSIKAAVDSGQNALKEYSFRRLGLAISSVLLTILAVALYLLIRSLPPPEEK